MESVEELDEAAQEYSMPQSRSLSKEQEEIQYETLSISAGRYCRSCALCIQETGNTGRTRQVQILCHYNRLFALSLSSMTCTRLLAMVCRLSKSIHTSSLNMLRRSVGLSSVLPFFLWDAAPFPPP